MNEKVAHDAREAKMILGHHLFKGAFADVRESLVESIENGPLDDDAVRDKLFCSLQCLKLIKEAIEVHIETGLIHNPAVPEEE